MNDLPQQEGGVDRFIDCYASEEVFAHAPELADQTDPRARCSSAGTPVATVAQTRLSSWWHL